MQSIDTFKDFADLIKDILWAVGVCFSVFIFVAGLWLKSLFITKISYAKFQAEVWTNINKLNTDNESHKITLTDFKSQLDKMETSFEKQIGATQVLIGKDILALSENIKHLDNNVKQYTQNVTIFQKENSENTKNIGILCDMVKRHEETLMNVNKIILEFYKEKSA